MFFILFINCKQNVKFFSHVIIRFWGNDSIFTPFLLQFVLIGQARADVIQERHLMVKL